MKLREILGRGQRTLSRGAILLAAMAALPTCARADAGIPMIAFSFPIMVVLLVFVVLIEAAYFRMKIKTTWKDSLLSLGKANLLTTLLGFPLTWIALVAVEIPLWFLLAKALDRHKHLQELLNTTPGRALGVVLSAAWLGPTESKWPVVAAFLVLLVPAYFASAWIEAKIVSTQNSNENGATARTAVWRANLLSYLFLAVVGALILHYELRR